MTSDKAVMSEEARRQLLDRIEQLIEEKDFEELRQLLSDSRASDVAEVVEVVDEIARQVLFDLLDPEDAGEVLEKIDEATRGEVVEDLTHKELTDIVATLPPDEAADVLAELSDEQTNKVLDQIPQEEAAEIEKLLGYDEESAGGIMNPELVRINIHDTVRDAIHQFRQSDPAEDFYYVFVVDDQGRYKGAVSLPTMLRHSRQTPIAEVIEEQLPTVNVQADQEEIANIFRKNDLIVMPVVDDQGILLGRITVDDIVDVMEEEAEEDVLVMAGTHPSERDTPNIFRAATIRLPWLLTCMAGSMLTGVTLISLFAPHFSKAEWVSIVMFLPALAAMGGNSGLQTSTVVVRGLATGDLVALKLAQVFFRESRVALVVAGSCALFAGLTAGIWLFVHPGSLEPAKAPFLGLSVGLAMFCGIMLSTTLGFLLPFVFRRFGIDPAISSGPLVTTANDAVGCLTYFCLALSMLHIFHVTL
ncbi:MAG: magnesium transporter [Sedimentisphaerales bacterium]|nr:magnesium transporter [Sedimentisphaerales bacterium]